MNKSFFLIILLSLIGCSKKETIPPKKTALPKETVLPKETAQPDKDSLVLQIIDAKFPLYLDKIDFDDKRNYIQVNDEINSKIRKTVNDFYNNDSGVYEEYKVNFKLNDCHFKTIRLQAKSQTIFVIILKFMIGDGLIAKVLFYDNNSKQFIGEPVDFKIYALYDFVDSKIIPGNLKEELKIMTPEINLTAKENEFKFIRLWHNGTFNALETAVLKASGNKIDTVKFTKKGLSPEFFNPS